MALPYTIPFHIRVARKLLRPLFRGLFYMLSPVKITGQENIPRHGAYIIAANHVSLYDPPLVVAYWPSAVEAIGAADIWQRRGQSFLIRMYGVIPAHRGSYDRHLLNQMVGVLKAGRPLLIAPEGGRSHQPGMRRAKPGLAYIVEKCRVPVVPVGIVGTTDDYFKKALRGGRPPLEIRVGKPIILPPIQSRGVERHTARQRHVDKVMTQIAALLPEEYRGVYG